MLGVQRDVEEELAYVRLNILLSKDALAKLDIMKEKAGLASRGRTIQALVDEVWAMKQDARQLLKIIDKDPEPNSNIFITKMMFWLMDIIRRLYAFGE